MSRFFVLSLCLLFLTTSTVRADDEKAPQTPEVRAMHQLMDSKKVWSKIGKKSQWHIKNGYVVEDMNDLSPVKQGEGRISETLYDSKIALLKAQKFLGVVHCAEWRVEGPGEGLLKTWFTIKIRVYKSEEEQKRAQKSESNLAKMLEGSTKRRGKRTTVVGRGVSIFEDRHSIEVSAIQREPKRHLQVADVIHREFKKLVKEEEKVDAKRKKEEEKRQRDRDEKSVP